MTLLHTYSHWLGQGLYTTCALAAVAWCVGIVLGILMAAAVSIFARLLAPPFRCISALISGVPVLVALVWLHYPAQDLLGIVVDPFVTAAFTLSLYNTFSVAELVANGIRDFPQSYLIAAKTCGLSDWQIFRRIVLPVLARKLSPGILIQQVQVLHLTMFASLIAVDELFRQAQRIAMREFRPVESYTVLALFFLSLTLSANGLASFLRRRYTRQLVE